MKVWISHPRNGQPDTMLTLAVGSTVAILLKVLLNGVILTLGEHVINFGSIDGTLVAAVITPTLGAYVARKMKDSPDCKKEE